MGEVLEAAWLPIASFLVGNGGYTTFILLPIVFGALGYSFLVTAIGSTIMWIVIHMDPPKARDLDEARAWYVGLLITHLLAFWIFHKAAQFIFRPSLPLHQWLLYWFRHRG
jgi:hypothetical protein